MLGLVKRIRHRIVMFLLPKSWQVAIRDFHIVVDSKKNLERSAARDLQQKYEFLMNPRKRNQVKRYMKESHRSEINKYEIMVYSQNGEDGILLYIFSKIGIKNHKFVEFGIGDGKECNTANLSIDFGWGGLLMDAVESDISAAKLYYGKLLGENVNDVKIVHCLVTVENINRVLRDNGIQGEIDLLSIDIDGNDYWVWKAITAINPRVVVIEYNASLGYEKSLAVGYDPVFDRYKKHPSGLYYGASLAALTMLAHSKGYNLIGCESNGINAFFIRNDVAKDHFSDISPREAYFPNSHTSKVFSEKRQFEITEHLDFVNV
jgi:hypothetical protein